MKRILLVLGIVALLLPAARHAQAADVSIDFFYNNLGDDGNWIEAGDYGYCWQPSVAVGNPNWRPYADGYWAYTNVGWTWVSYENFGWATYHYGRWAQLHNQGWVWVPGTEWGPAWVSWRTGGDYVGWAPLPPRYATAGGEPIYEGRPITGHVDIEFDIGPAYYNFVDVRYIGEPVLRERIFAPTQNITYINQTVNVTNITYQNSQVYNYGPDYNRLSSYSTRPIRRLTLEREQNVDFGRGNRDALNRVQGDRLLVAGPERLQKAPPQAAPKVVKTKIAKPDLETGWTGMSDPNAKAQLQDKFKKEDNKSVPPSKLQPVNPGALATASPGNQSTATEPSPNAPSIAAPGSSPVKGKPAPLHPNPTPVAAGSRKLPSATPGVSPNEQKGNRGRNEPIVKPTPPLAASPEAVLPLHEATPANRKQGGPDQRGRNKSEKNATPPNLGSASSEANMTGGAPTSSNARAGKSMQGIAPLASATPPPNDGNDAKKNRRHGASVPAGTTTSDVPPADSMNQQLKKQNSGRYRIPPNAEGANPVNGNTGVVPPDRVRHMQEPLQKHQQLPVQQVAPRNVQPVVPAEGAQNQRQARPEKGKKKSGDQSPSPAPNQ